MKQEMINEIGKYLRENVEDFDVRVNLALKTMDRKRCSFDFADCDLHNECYDKIEEWYEENGIEPEYIDVEEIIFEMDLVMATKVEFRIYPTENEVIALFPNEIVNSREDCASYMHIGQHSPADY
jgi:hypothetical protein